jgi:hypothetical protein
VTGKENLTNPPLSWASHFFLAGEIRGFGLLMRRAHPSTPAVCSALTIPRSTTHSESRSSIPFWRCLRFSVRKSRSSIPSGGCLRLFLGWRARLCLELGGSGWVGARLSATPGRRATALEGASDRAIGLPARLEERGRQFGLLGWFCEEEYLHGALVRLWTILGGLYKSCSATSSAGFVFGWPWSFCKGRCRVSNLDF